MQKRLRPILALDPGLRDLGFALLSGRRLLSSGVLPLRHVPHRLRRAEAISAVQGLIVAYHPRALVLEATYRHPLPAFDRVHRLARTLARLARGRRIEVAVYPAQTVRKRFVGDGWASKEEAAASVAGRFPALRVYLSQDRRWKERYWLNMFDAVALALHHASQPPSRSRSCG